MNFSNHFMETFAQTCKNIDINKLQDIIGKIIEVKKSNGRIFFIGVGGSAANASHAVNDFRKIAKIECYAPSDNVSELSARTNDEGWETVFSSWLEISKLNKNDMLFIFSVGGGNLEKNISPNIVKSIDFAIKKDAKICGIVGKDGGYTLKNSKNVILIPTLDEGLITPICESMQAVIWHLIVSHPDIKVNQTKWENSDGVK
jgi:D-sedoheptulose 7-phosphate isomerase